MQLSTQLIIVQANGVAGVFINLFLIFIIWTDTKLPGKFYRTLLITIAAYHVLLSSASGILEMQCIYDDQGYMCFSERLRHWGKWEGFYGSCLYAWMISQSLSLFALHCCYRFVKITGKYSYLFEHWTYILMVILISLIFSISYMVTVGVFMRPTSQRSELNRLQLSTEYNISSDDLGYAGTYFTWHNADGSTYYNVKHIVATIFCMLVLGIMYSTSCVVGFRMYCFVRDGAYTECVRRMQMQLLRLLFAQGIAPLLFEFGPLIVILCGGITGFLPEGSNMWVPILASIYPAADGLMMIILFKAYRDRFIYNVKRVVVFWRTHDDPAFSTVVKSAYTLKDPNNRRRMSALDTADTSMSKPDHAQS